MFQQKLECFHYGELNYKVEDTIFFLQLLCNIETKKTFKSKLDIQCMPERHFFSKRYRLHNKPPNF